MATNTSLTRTQKGFALLLTLIVISVVLAIGLSLLNITLKQFTLSVSARDSEIAFHAAFSGLDCMQYYRTLNSGTYVAGGSVNANCGGVSASPTRTATTFGAANIYHYMYRFDGVGETNACVETSMYVIDMRTETNPLDGYNLSGEGLEEISCAPGVVCTTIFSRGYNRGCNDLSSIRTVQRELTVQF